MNNNISQIAAKWRAARATLMPKVGAIMLQFTDERFREQGWKDSNLKPWQKRKSNKDTSRSILIKSGALRRGNRIVSTTDHSVTMGNDLPYARAHNDGMHERVTVKGHSRKSFSKTTIETNKLTKSGKPRKATALKVIGAVEVKSFTRNMNLPERRFMGKSRELSKRVRNLITAEVNKCFK